jgi:RNA-directed DNA polymerase
VRGRRSVPTRTQWMISATGTAVQGHSLFGRLCDPRHLKRAARRCMRRSSSPGADGLSWARYRRDLDVRLADLAARLRADEWRPPPANVVFGQSYTAKRFRFVVPTVEERVVHRALRDCVEPVIEANALADAVHGYRPRRNRVTAVRHAAALLDRGPVVLDVDVASVSAGGTVDTVIDSLAYLIADGELLTRVRHVLNALPEPLTPGTGLAPLLVNLRLTPVDAALAGFAFVRFADNFCVFCADDQHAADASACVTDALTAEGLAPAPAKSRVRHRPNPEDLFLIAG